MTTTLPPSTKLPGARPGPLARLTDWSARHRLASVLIWVALLAAVTVAAQSVGSAYHDDHSLPGTESQDIADLLEDRAPKESGDTLQIVVSGPEGDIANGRANIESMLDKVDDLDHVDKVDNPYPAKHNWSDDGTVGFATVTLDGKAADIPDADVRDIIDTAKDAETGDLRVELGGDPIRGAEESAGGPAEGAGMLAALVILVFMFGSLLAAAVPLGTAIFAVGSTLGAITLASQVFTLPSYLPPLMMLVGLGVGVDYALLIFSRYRTEILGGADRATAARVAADTAGRSVLFAGCTVIVALLGLYALGLGSLQGVALGVALTVAVTMLASITLLPALLAIFGRRIEARILKRGARSGKEPGRGWRRWGAFMQRRPVVPLLLAVAALAAMCVPAFDLRLGFADAGTDTPGSTSRASYELMAEGFGPGANGPILVITEGSLEDAQTAADELREADGVEDATPAIEVADDLAMVQVFPTGAPQDDTTSQLVTDLREEVLPPIADDTGATYLVGGSTAATVDFADAVSQRMPLFLLLVIGLSSLLLMAVFRSVLIPIKAAILNLLSIGASLGVVTLVYQYGWFGAQPGPVEAFVPTMIFAIVFGLSMDYEVFLVSRMHEEWGKSGDADHAVREGLANTGGVITAAAAIMIVVFGAFVLSADRMLQQFGLGLAVAIAVDALVIRCLVVPTVMRLLGARAWWLPRWLDRALPKIRLESEATGAR